MTFEMIDLTKQIQTGGGHSTAIQGARDIYVVQQADREYIEAVARDVIRKEIETLTAHAVDTFKARAEEFVRDFIARLARTKNHNISKLDDPRFQFALHDAEKEYGKSGSSEL
jgi:hypothetical protein